MGVLVFSLWESNVPTQVVSLSFMKKSMMDFFREESESDSNGYGNVGDFNRSSPAATG